MLISGQFAGFEHSQGGCMFLMAATIVIAGTSVVLWWKLRLVREENVLLRTEVSKLRRRLHNLLP
jgi:hypothetical protein